MRSTYSISVLHTQIVVLQIDIQVGQDQLPRPTHQNEHQPPHLTRQSWNAKEQPKHTSSLIFFQIILVISSPSNSTTGFLTLIF